MANNPDIRVEIQTAALDVGAGFAFLQTPAAGGVCLFVGTTRQWTSGVETVSLSYEAYEPMALREMRRLAELASERWGALRCIVQHRLGKIPPPEASVLIGVATPHRADAFEACRFLIDELKREVPIWKMERYRDGRTEWVSPVEGKPGS